MGKITLHVKDKEVQTLLGILGNLREGIIESMEVEEAISSRPTQYQPKSNRIISDDQRPSGKYLSASAFKSKLKKP